jgi:prepilin-type processing-associated H-X9-DG protein
MPIPFTCPHCGNRTDVDEKYAGQSGACAKCGQTIVVPMFRAPNAAIAPPRASRGGSGGVVIAIVLGGVGLMVVLACAGILVGLLLPAVQAARSAANRVQSQNNLRQIGLALLNYEATYQVFPPQYLTDKSGQPTHSWRTLILPFLEQENVFRSFDLSQPWDSEANRSTSRQPIPLFASPNAANADPTTTNYVAIAGPGHLFDGTNTVRLSDITDGTSNTIALVESIDPGIAWAEPRDLDPSAATSVTGPFPGGVNCLFCDGSVRFVSQDLIQQQSLTPFLTINGGETVFAP